MKLQVNGKIRTTSNKENSRAYAEIRIDKRECPDFPHKKEDELPICLLIGQIKYQTVIRERHKLNFYWISQKGGLWELLEKSGYSLNESVLLDVNTNAEQVKISIRDKKEKVEPAKRSLSSNYLPEEVEDETISCIEGAIKRVSVNAYERSPEARNKCVKKYGYQCTLCGFDFERAYGKAGERFILVHHLIPLSEIRGEYTVNGEKDLRPVCANCHAIIHRFSPCLSIEELTDIIQKQRP